MPRKRRPKRKMKGEGPALDWIKKTAGNVHNFVKKHKLISKSLAAITPFAGTFAPLTSGASAGAAALGYGRKRPKRKPRKK